MGSLGSQVFAKNYTECYAKQHCHRTAKSVQLLKSKLWHFIGKKIKQMVGGMLCSQHATRSCDIWSVGVMLYWLMMLGSVRGCHCLFIFVVMI